MSSAPSSTLKRRHDAVRAAIAARGLDALVVTSLPNILYLTNFKGSSAIVVLSADRLVFITDFRYVTSMDAARGTEWECRDLDLVRVDTSYDEALAGVLATMPRARVGFEAAHLTVSRHGWLESRLTGDGRQPDAPTLTPTEGIIEAERVRKDTYEIATLREAARRLSQVAAGV